MEELGDGVEQCGAATRPRQGAEHAGPGLERSRSTRVLGALRHLFLVHCDTFRAITAGRNARSTQLFVGSIDGSSKNRSSDPASSHRPNSLSNRWLSRSDSRRSSRWYVRLPNDFPKPGTLNGICGESRKESRPSYCLDTLPKRPRQLL